MNLKELQQKINELVEHGHGDAIVCTWNQETWEHESDVSVYPRYGYYINEEGYTKQDFTIVVN